MEEKSIDITLRERIRKEREREQMRPVEEVYQRVCAGEIVGAVGNLLFHTVPTALNEKIDIILEKVAEAYTCGDIKVQVRFLEFLVNLSIGLGSFLPAWILLKDLDVDTITGIAEQVLSVLEKLIRIDEEAPEKLTVSLRRETVARLRAEGLSDENETEAMADKIMGVSLPDYVSNIVSELNSSNLPDIARAHVRGETQTQLGNDYAAFLQYMIWLGGSFVTTNPVLVKLAWDIDPQLWNKRVDDLIVSKYTHDQLKEFLHGQRSRLDQAVTEFNSMITMAVVEENCRLLRDIFLVTEGSEGYVSLQVNPKNHDDCDQMVTEAESLYAYLEQRLGGVPNVVFKLPATAAGKLAAEKLTSEGIGVTITVEFSVFQALGFAEVLNKGKMLVAYLALMNGRMVFPVRDEMKEKNIRGGVEAARWAGVEVARKAYRRLYEPLERGGMGIDPKRIRLLIASLRIYDDWIPDISELWGCPVITIFPDVRRKYDSHRREFIDKTVLRATSPRQIKTLFESEIFRQAWWVPDDSEENKPKRVLTLEQQDKLLLAKWPPVANTLGQFIDLYEQMSEMIKERIKHIVESQRD
ncbi:MAG: transaldolase family protein [Planctomycetota bacterium]